jgi:hypothetical protein
MYNAGSEEGNLEGHFNNRESSDKLAGFEIQCPSGPFDFSGRHHATQGPELSIRKEPPNNSEASPMFWDLAC